MEMTVGTIAVSTVSGASGQQNAASSADAGFSEILSGVRSTSNARPAQKQPGSANSSSSAQDADRTAQAVSSDNADYAVQDGAARPDIPSEAENALSSGKDLFVQEAQASAETLTIEEVSVKLEAEIVEIVKRLVPDADKEQEDKIIEALLEYLKKMQQSGEGDNAVSLAMQLLMSMLGVQQVPTAELSVTIQNVSAEITAVNAVYSSTSTAVRQEASEEAFIPFENAGEQELVPEYGTQDGEEPLGTNAQPENRLPEEASAAPAEAETPVKQDIPVQEEQVRTAEQITPVITEQDVQLPQDVQPAQDIQPVHIRQDVQPEMPQTAETAEQMLEGILEQARKDLGLVKAEFTRTEAGTKTAADTVQTEALPEQPVRNSKAAILEIRPNHRDGRNELDDILGEKGGQKTEEPQKTVMPEQNAESAGLGQSVLNRETAPVTKDEAPRTAAIPPERQLADEIISRTENMSGGRDEFTMVLNPETLGKITVRLASTGGRIEVSITAENDSTRQLLESRTEQLGAALRENGVELERYQVVSGQENAQLMQDSYDGSSRNPYGRQEEEDGEENGEDNGNDFLDILQQI